MSLFAQLAGGWAGVLPRSRAGGQLQPGRGDSSHSGTLARCREIRERERRTHRGDGMTFDPRYLCPDCGRTPALHPGEWELIDDLRGGKLMAGKSYTCPAS